MLRLMAITLLVLLAFNSVNAAGTDVDGKPLNEELAGKLKECDPPGPELPNNPEEPDPETKDPETKDPETKDPETKDPETKDPETKDPETKDPETKDPETKDPETKDPETKDPEESDDCKDDYTECPGEIKLCKNKTYAKMMKSVCKKTCDTCP